MELFQNKPDTLAVSAAYPYSGIKDDTGSNDGTLVNQNTLNDYVQFFEKIFNESGDTANGLPDNATNGFQLVEAAKKVFRPYKSYVALISQVGTAAPTVKVLENNLGAAIAWSRSGAGDYGGTLVGAFTLDKTVAFLGGFNSAAKFGLCGRLSNDAVALLSDTDGTFSDTSLEIRVYY